MADFEKMIYKKRGRRVDPHIKLLLENSCLWRVEAYQKGYSDGFKAAAGGAGK